MYQLFLPPRVISTDVFFRQELVVILNGYVVGICWEIMVGRSQEPLRKGVD